MPKTDQKRVAINIMTQLCGPADKIDPCTYLDGFEICIYRYVAGDVDFGFASKAGELSCINVSYGAYKLGPLGAHGYALLGTRIQNQCFYDKENKWKFIKEFEEK